MQWVFVQWGRFLWWVDHLSPRRAAMYGAVGLLALGGLGKYILVPFLNRLFKFLGDRLYPLLSGAFFINRFVSLPKYFKNIQTTVGRIRNPWLLEGQELRDIFVPVSVNRGIGSSERCDVRQMLGTLRAAVVVGEPGSGKTTALKAIAMMCIRDGGALGLVPVYISLRAWSVAGSDLTKHTEEIFRDSGFPNAGRYLKKLRQRGELVFLLDGLDEVDESKRTFIIEGVRGLLRDETRKNGCHVYITSRPVGYDGQFSDLIQETAYMEDFTPAQIRQFIGNWDFRQPKSGSKLVQALVSRPSILLICRNPLMLTIVTSLYRETEYQLPDSRDAFYKVCIQALLTRWDAAKELQDRNRFPEGLKEAFLQDLAFDFLSQRSRELSASGVLKQAEAFLDQRKRSSIEPEAFVREIVRSGLLGKLPTGELYFAHKTFAEELAASRFRNQPQELMGLWDGAPDAWLEVCSLFVSDSLTPVQDIQIVLNHGINRGSWLTAIVLAGEAHTVPDELRSRMLDRLQGDTSLWPNLDKRAMAALARFGNAARPLLTTFMTEPSLELRRLAIYALGQSAESWAKDLLIAALTDPATRKSAAESLGGLGDDAVVLIEDLLRSASAGPELQRACVEIAGIVGTAAALRAIMPLLWSDAAVETALQVVHSLWRPEIRTDLESEDIALPPAPGKAANDLARWAFPWVADSDSDLRAYYARLIEVLAGFYGRAEDVAKKGGLDSVPPDYLVPLLITLDDSSLLSAKDSNSKSPWPIAAAELSKRPGDKNRVLWSRVTAADKKDLMLSPEWSRAWWAAAQIVLFAIVWHSWRIDLLPWWCIILPTAAPVVVVVVSIMDREAKVLSLIGASATLVSDLLYAWRETKEEDRPWMVAFILVQLATLGAATYTASRLGGLTWVGVTFSALPCLLPSDNPDREHVEHARTVLYRRSNPLRRLRESLSQMAPKLPPAATVPPSSLGMVSSQQAAAPK